MPLFPRSQKITWHRELMSSGAADRLADGNLAAFPYQHLTQLTESLLSRKKLASPSEQADSFLDGLVADHVEREGGLPEVAILACLGRYTKATAINSLIELRGDAQERPGFTKYLRCLVVARSIDSSLLSDAELRVSVGLMQIRAGEGDLFDVFRDVVTQLGSISRTDVLPPAYVNRLMDYCQIRRALRSCLSRLRTERRLMSLYKAISWVNTVPSLPFSTAAMSVLSVQLPSWKFWAAWKPNWQRLMQWEAGNLTREQKRRLARIFDLEGPDLTASGLPTFKDVIPDCFETIAIDRHDPDLVQRILDTLDQAQDLHLGKAGVDLFIYMCVDNPAGDESLSFVSHIFQMRNEACCEASLSLTSRFASESGFNDRMVALTEGLPVLQAHEKLQELFGDVVVGDITSVMSGAQKEYLSQLGNGLGENLALKIQAFGTAVLAATWTHTFLPSSFLKVIQRFPSRDTLQGVFDELHATPGLLDMTKAYLAGSLGGKGGDDVPSMLRAIQEERNFWLVSAQDPERTKVLHAIRALQYIEDLQFVTACREQIIVEDKVFLRDIFSFISRDTNISCVSFARTLARRHQRRSTTHHVWPSLLLFMMKQRGRELLTWSCETLPVDAWFQWSADVQMIFAEREPLWLDVDLGFTASRRYWWSQLSSEYLDAVYHLEDIHRRKGAPLTWLYLQNVANVEFLLKVIVERQNLERYYRSVLSYLKPELSVITKVCDCLAALQRASDLGRLAVISTLARREQDVEPWPEEAIEALFLGWLRLPGLSQWDKEALTILAALSQVTPSSHPQGVAIAVDSLHDEYEDIIQEATQIEALRVTLRFDDAQRTSALLARLGIEDARSPADPAIPDDLIDAIERVGDQEYELCFCLTEMQQIKRKLCGISETSRLLVVRVSLRGQPGFCLHLSPDDGEPEHHIYQRPVELLPDVPACTASHNIFTYTLGRNLRRLFSQHSPGLRQIYDHVSNVIKSPAAECVSCSSPFGNSIWRPTTCASDWCCTDYYQAPLSLRLSSFLSDPPVLDFLLACVGSAAMDTGALDLLPGCPVEKSRIGQVIESFPPLPADGTTPAELLRKIQGVGGLSGDRMLLLSWMCAMFRGCMLSAPQGKRVPLMPGVYQFLMFNSSPEREMAFASQLPSNTNGVVFHGTPAPRLWKVLTEGLKNMSNTPFMINGAASGPGIYLADEPVTSLAYSGTLTNCWSRSAFLNKRVMFGCELQGHSARGIHAISDEARVLIRYVFLCPAGFTAPQARLIENAMKMTYATLRRGPT